MDHVWDRDVLGRREAEAERGRYERRLEEDHEGEQRESARERERERARRRTARSPWEIGASHWDQRDLYTTNPRVDDGGYAVGPRVHPEVGSYAYRRDLRAEREPTPPRLYEREAWPWRYYGVGPEWPEQREGLWRRVRSRVLGALGRERPRVWPSDARIREDVSRALDTHGELDASDVEVAVRDAEVTLTGTVPSRRDKKLAKELAERCLGVRDVRDRLRVRRDDDGFVLGAPAQAV